jgi:hypothetical protein
MIKKILPFLLTLALIGCSSTGQLGEQVIGNPGSPMWFASASLTTQVYYYKTECKAYGYKDGTSQMAQCLQSSIQKAKEGARARLDAFSYSQRQYNQRFRCNTFGYTTTCKSY